MKFSVGLSALAFGAIITAAPVMGASINLGGNGSGVLGTGLLTGTGGGTTTQPSGNSALSVNTNINGGGTTGTGGTGSNLLNLFGDGQGPTTATATIGNGVSGSGTLANGAVNLGSGDGTGSGNVLLNLFGNGGQSGNANVDLGVAGLGSGTGTGDGAGTTGDVNLNLFGDGTTPIATTPGSTGGGDGLGGGSGGSTGGSGGVGLGIGTTNVASLDGSTAGCFAPNANQLAKLVGRHTYDAATFDGWMGIKTIKVIRAGICASAARDIAGEPNIGQLQNYISTNAALRDRLAQWGHGPADVIAVDRQGSTLIMYVA